MPEEKFARYDSADYLKTEEDIAAYLEAVMEDGGDDPEESGPVMRQAGHFDAPVVDEPEPKKKRRFRR